MKSLNSNSFLEAWISIVDRKKEILQNGWRNARAFTTLVKGCEDSIIREVAEKLDLKCYAKDYYSIDTILYDDEDLVPGIPKNSFWFRQIKVAFEHENFFGAGLYQEVAHLLIVNSDLKVLVTYPDRDPTSTLKQLHSIIKGCRQQKEISDKENFLIILGYETILNGRLLYIRQTIGSKSCKARTHNKSIANSGTGRWSNRQPVR